MKTSALKALLPVLTAFGLLNPSLTFSAPAKEPRIDRPQAGFYRFKVGTVHVTSLSDGTIDFNFEELFKGGKPGEVKKLLAKYFLDSPTPTSVNAYLVEMGDKLVLVDTGSGETLGPTANKLTQSLASAGIKPEQITDIAITHLHPDHIGGLSTGDRKNFPNATVHVSKTELDYWTNKDTREKAAEPAKTFFGVVDAKLRPYTESQKVKTFAGAVDLLPGFRTQPSPGHTPGQSFYVLESGGQTLIFWGDIIHAPNVQLENPNLTIAFDVDPKAAASGRKKVLDEAVAKRHLLATPHTNFPGVGHILKEGKSYRWVPVSYVNDSMKP